MIATIVRDDTKHTDAGRTLPVSMCSSNGGVAQFFVSHRMFPPSNLSLERNWNDGKRLVVAAELLKFDAR